MSKLAHSNQQTMDKIERDARGRDERGDPDEGSLRNCASCGAILAPGPQPAATYESEAGESPVDNLIARLHDATDGTGLSRLPVTKILLLLDEAARALEASRADLVASENGMDR